MGDFQYDGYGRPRCEICGGVASDPNPVTHLGFADLRSEICPDSFHCSPDLSSDQGKRVWPDEVYVDIDSVGEPFVCDEDGGIRYVRRDLFTETRQALERAEQRANEMASQLAERGGRTVPLDNKTHYEESLEAQLERAERALHERQTWSFDTLLYVADRLLAEFYPEDIFPDVRPEDEQAGDPGPQLVRAVRRARSALATPEDSDA